MNIVWIYPILKRCGISIYSNEYIQELSNNCKITSIDTEQALKQWKETSIASDKNQCVHIQYETSFFLGSNAKRFERLCSSITIPIVCTIHEVYEQFPGVFPEVQITGKGVVRRIKQKVYDIRHPYQMLYKYHCNNAFFAQHLIVHAYYHKEILMKQGLSEKTISVIPVPVPAKQQKIKQDKKSPIHLASCGFVNQNYNYELLFEVLRMLDVPWRFTWIGGIRRSEDEHLLEWIRKEVINRGWQEKFHLTGWVEEQELVQLLDQTDIYLALLKNKSSSASIAKALGLRKTIIATSLPLTEELVSEGPIMTVVQPKAESVVREINRILGQMNDLKTQSVAIEQYLKNNSYEISAQKLITLYKELTSEKGQND